MWVDSERRFGFKKEVTKKIDLAPKEELGCQRIVAKMDEVWGGMLKKGDNSYKERDWIGLFG